MQNVYFAVNSYICWHWKYQEILRRDGKMFFRFALFPAGYTFGDAVGTLRHDPLAILNIVILLAALAVIMLLRLRNFHVDKIVPLQQPLEGMTSADVGYIQSGTCEEQDITALLIELAADRCITIDQYDRRAFRIIPLQQPSAAGNGMLNEMYDAVSKEGHAFPADGNIHASQDRVRPVPLRKMRDRLGKVVDDISSEIKMTYSGEKALFTKHATAVSILSGLLFIAGLWVASVLTVYHAEIVSEGEGDSPLFMFLIPLIWTVCISLFMAMLIAGIRSRKREGISSHIIGVVFALLFYVFFIYLGIGLVSVQLTPINAMALLIYVIVGPLLFLIHKPYSEYGRKVLNQTRGLKKWIETPEQGLLASMVQTDPAYVYQILPYAYVFGLENIWLSHFKGMTISTPPIFTSSWDAITKEPRKDGTRAIPPDECGVFAADLGKEVERIIEVTSRTFNTDDD